MSTKADDADSSNFGADIDIQCIDAKLDQAQQEPTPLSSYISETEQLLDIDGLLEIERLISRIKEDGRLKYYGEGHTD